MHRTLMLFSVVTLALGAACADKTPEPEGPPIGKHVLRPGEPPMQAFEACSGKTAGITCSMGYRHGTCGMPESGEPRLACLTEGSPIPGNAPSK